MAKDSGKDKEIKMTKDIKSPTYLAACKIIFKDKTYQRGEELDSKHVEYAVAHNLVIKKRGRG